MKIDNSMTMKMKLNPEYSCLEAQEKFWRGRFKEIHEKFTEERQKLEISMIQISTETLKKLILDKRLKNELNKISTDISKCSVSVQTTVPIDEENNEICECCQRPLIKTRTIFSKNKGISHDIVEEENKCEFFIDSDLVLRESAAVDEYNDNEDEKIDVPKIIKKLFSSDDRSDSQRITSKLLELYKIRSKSIPDLLYDETDYDGLNQVVNKLILPVDSDKILKKHEIISDDSEKNHILNETTYQHAEISKETRSRRRFLPKVHNIRKKVFKNFSKIRKTCTNIKFTDSDDNITSSNIFNNSKNSSQNLKLQPVHKVKNEGLKGIQALPKYQLISAMKKSKSTENIVKKVAFSDDLPSTKTVSESNVFQLNDYRLRRQPDTKPLLIGSVHVHHDKFARPIPAPRSKKNVTLMDS